MTNCPDEIKVLVDRYSEHKESYSSSSYNETQLRREFVDPFFKSLGWDVDNEQGYAEAYKDVIHEDSIKIGGSTKAPDYCFRIGGVRKIFVETKKPSINIKNDIHPAFQVRRYAWSAKLPLSILTDFEEFAVYACREKPIKTDKASKGRILYLTYDQYESKWDEIKKVFSKEAILKGSFDKYAESTKGKRGTSEVDNEFLIEIERWRELLAKNIALRNPALTQRELNFAVQRTIDRIIFLRICEDRGIEHYGTLMALLNGEHIYDRMRQNFRKADDVYNSGLFHFRDEKGRAEPPDTLTLTLQLDDKPLKDIIKNLYYPESPYEFAVLPSDILGQVYERFLGSVIRLTKGHQAKVEEKPEVKKSGGVFYTPTYIVDYIVNNTVGKLIEGKSPKQIEKIKILDPACGSGTFLIQAYQFLLIYIRDWYINDNAVKHAKGNQPKLTKVLSGEWRLSTTERKTILLNSIFGVDIDSQAVEVTKLSLLLKVLEGENEQSLAQQMSLFQERALPDLENNIKCGNSLIDSKFYNTQQIDIFNEDTQYRINVFDWKNEYKKVFDAGGFDVVIGNPPYIRIQALKEWAPIEVEYYKDKFNSASAGNYDIYVIFIEQGYNLLAKNGKLGFILPHKFFNAKYGYNIRSFLSSKQNLSEIVHFGSEQVFETATTYTCLIFLQNKKCKNLKFSQVPNLIEWKNEGKCKRGDISNSNFNSDEWQFALGNSAKLFNKLEKIPTRLDTIANRIFQGFKTGADPVFILEKSGLNKYFSKALNREISLEPKFLRQLYKSGNMKRYLLKENERSVIFPYENGKLIDWKKIEKFAPKTAAYLFNCKNLLAKREKGKWTGVNWYCYSRNQALEIMSSLKILTADLNPSASFCIDETGTACFPGGAAGGYGIVVENKLSYLILGLLNSSLIDFYLQNITTTFRGGWFGYDARVLRRIPIVVHNDKNQAIIKEIEKNTKLLIESRKIMAKSKIDHDREIYSRKIKSLDIIVDELVCQLYKISKYDRKELDKIQKSW